MWHTLYIECPLYKSPSVHKVAVFYSKSTDFILFNHCNFCGDCVGCKDFCEDYIRTHPDSGFVVGSASHPLSPWKISPKT